MHKDTMHRGIISTAQTPPAQTTLPAPDGASRDRASHGGVCTGGAAPRRRRSTALWAAAGGVALSLSALTAAPAWAHDELLSSTPEAGDVLSESPEEITLEFTGDGLTEGENIPNEIRVSDDDGGSWATETVIDGATMSTELDGELPDGEYEVLYRVVYSDGHDEEGTYSFEVESADDASGADTAGSDEEAAGSEEDAADEGGAGGIESTDQTSADEAQDDPATLEGQLPAWATVLFALGGVLVVVLALVLMRRKMTQAEEWKKAPRQPRDTPASGSTAAGSTSAEIGRAHV